jgi:hypothetical protein
LTKLHKLGEIGIGTVHDGDATRSDLTIDGGEVAEENVIEHKHGILTNPVPGRVENDEFKPRRKWAEHLQHKCRRACARCCPAELESLPSRPFMYRKVSRLDGGHASGSGSKG